MSGEVENFSRVKAVLRKFLVFDVVVGGFCLSFINKEFQFILRNLYLGYVHRKMKFC